jgi:hypothetical protein
VENAHGVWKPRVLQRRPYEDRWQKYLLEMVAGVPWNVSKEDVEADGIVDQDELARAVDDETSRWDSQTCL